MAHHGCRRRSWSPTPTLRGCGLPRCGTAAAWPTTGDRDHGGQRPGRVGDVGDRRRRAAVPCDVAVTGYDDTFVSAIRQGRSPRSTQTAPPSGPSPRTACSVGSPIRDNPRRSTCYRRGWSPDTARARPSWASARQVRARRSTTRQSKIHLLQATPVTSILLDGTWIDWKLSNVFGSVQTVRRGGKPLRSSQNISRCVRRC